MDIRIKAAPDSHHDEVRKMEKVLADGVQYVVKVKAPPIHGKANRAIVRVLADYFKVPALQVKVVSGHTSRNKVVRIVNS